MFVSSPTPDNKQTWYEVVRFVSPALVMRLQLGSRPHFACLRERIQQPHLSITNNAVTYVR